MRRLLGPIVGNRRGQGLIEYVLIVTLVGSCLVAILGLASTTAQNIYTRSSSTISRQTSAGGYGGGGGALGGWSGSGVATPPPGGSASADDDPADGDPSDSTAVAISRQS